MGRSFTVEAEVLVDEMLSECEDDELIGACEDRGWTVSTDGSPTEIQTLAKRVYEARFYRPENVEENEKVLNDLLEVLIEKKVP